MTTTRYVLRIVFYFLLLFFCTSIAFFADTFELMGKGLGMIVALGGIIGAVITFIALPYAIDDTGNDCDCRGFTDDEEDSDKNAQP